MLRQTARRFTMQYTGSGQELARSVYVRIR
jgi:hypothetical protein